MVCQNCGKNEATTHMKQVINGDTAEQHLCAECAKHLGYGDMFTDFGLSLSDMFGGFFGDSLPVAGEIERCKKCGCTFRDIVRDGKVGCADCYSLFYDKLKPSLQRIHGRVNHNGKISQTSTAPQKETREHKIAKHKEELHKAIEEQNFELAAQLRDAIKALETEGEKNE